MKRWLFLLALFAGAAHAQSTIRIHFTYTPEGLAYLASQGTTASATTAAQISRLNTILSNSNSTTTVASAGWSTGVCCTQDHVYYAGPSDLGAGHGNDGNIPLMKQRDAGNADVTVIVSNYSEDIEGISDAIGATPSTAIVAVNADGLSDDVVAHEWCHLMGCNHQHTTTGSDTYGNAAAYVHWSGTSQADCEVWWTVEAQASIVNTTFYPGVTTVTNQCWELSNTGPCYGSGLAAVQSEVAVINGQGYPNCTVTQISSSSTQFQAEISCPNWGYAYFTASYQYTTSGLYGGPSFVCTNAHPIPNFSNPNATYPNATNGIPTGLVNGSNDVAQIDGFASTVANYRHTKRAQQLIEAIADPLRMFLEQ